MPIYTSIPGAAAAAESGVRVIDNINDQNGPPLVFQNRENWVHIPNAGIMMQAQAGDPGIYTTGQAHCLAIIVANFSGSVWSGAWLAHVGHEKHSKVGGVLGMGNDQSFVAIGARAGSLKRMLDVRDQCLAKGIKNVWIYVGSDGQSPDFGMNNQGYFGQTV